MTTQPLTSFERKEIKFLLNTKQKKVFLGLIAEYLKADEHGNQGKYQLMSLYYDSPEKDFYWEKQMKLPKRKKLRLRRYVGENPELQASDQIFIEIKEHTEAMNYKRRVLLPANEAFALLEAGKMPRSAQAEDQAVIEEIATLASQYRLEPSAITSYQRQAYKVRKKDGGIRITFDQQVKYRTDHLSLDWKLDDQSLIEEDMEIMEIKIKDELPVRTQAALQICGIEQAHFSKYSQAVQKGFSGLLTPPLHLEFDEDTDAQTWKVSNQTSRINAFEFAA